MLKFLGAYFFRFRDILPVPLVLLFRYARPKPLNWLVGVPLVVLGEMLRIWGLMHIGPTTRTRKISANRLTTSGPYAWCRNPLYLGNLLTVMGFLIIGGHGPLTVFTTAFFGLEFASLIAFEEEFLAQKFPEAHADYVRKVPAFFPNGSRFPTNEMPPFSLKEALTSERRTFTSTSLILSTLALVQFCRRESRVSTEASCCR